MKRLGPLFLPSTANPRDAIEEDRELPTTVLERIAEVCEREPSRVAVSQSEDELSYGELWRQTSSVGHALQERGLEREDVVAVKSEKSLGLIVGMLGVLRGGGAFFLLDGALPENRQRRLLEESGAQRLLYVGDGLEEEPWLAQRFRGAVTEISARGEPMEEHRARELPIVEGADSAYVFFTSGGTGAPKGVLGSHKGLIHFVDWQRKRFEIGREDRVSQLTSVSFDAMLRDVFLPLTSGARLCLPEPSLDSGSGGVLSWLEAEGVTVVHTVPTLAATWLKDSDSGSTLNRLRYLFFSGEALPAELVRKWRARLGGQVVNLYGPTETTMTKSCYVVPADVRDGVQPLGEALPQCQLLVLGEGGEECGVGEKGEIVIRTPYRSKGYVNASEEEHKRFVRNPFRDDEDDIVYMTGDFGRYRGDGELEWLGRKDDQLKVRGARVEPAEVEQALRGHASVRGAAVTGRALRGGELGLVAYVLPDVLPDGRSSASRDELRRYLRERLPEYMVPSVWVWVEKFPLLPSGKVDRRALSEPELDPREEVSYEAPRTRAEEQLAKIWGELLLVERVGARDNFFELGGHSLLAARVMSRIAKTFGVELPVRALFDAPTVCELSRELETRREQGSGSPGPELGRVERKGRLLLSYSQQRLWFLDELESDLSAYNMCSAHRLRGELDVRALERALGEVVRRHEVLRTRFESRDGEAEQVVEPAQDWRLTVLEFQGSKAQRQTRLKDVLRGESERRFELARGGLFRAVLVRLEEEEHVLVLNVHHIVSDGWSQGIVKRELVSLYEAYQDGEDSPLAELPIQYVDYAVWQRKWLEGDVMERQLGYWREQLSDLSPLELPTDRPRPAVQSYRGGACRVEVSATLTRTLKRLSVESGTSLYMTLLAVLMTLLYRYTGREDIVVGSPTANRTREETEGLVGLFLNTLVLRGDLSGRPSFREVLERVRETCLEAFRYQDVPFEKLVEELSPERELGRHPLFQVLLTLQNTTDEDATFATLKEDSLGEDSSHARFDLELDIWEKGGRLISILTYSRDLFDEATAKRMASQWHQLLDSLANDPDQRIEDVSFLTPAQRHQLLVEWNDTREDYPLSRSFHTLLAEQIARDPDATAAVDERTSISYGELGRRSHQLARALSQKGVGPDVVVSVVAERTVELLIALVGVLEARGVYLALAPEHPGKRHRQLLAESGATVIVSTRDTRDQVERLRAAWPERTRPSHVELESTDNTTAETLPGAVTARIDDAAYIIFTSGSTGVPKGAVVDHGGMVNHLFAMRSVLRLGELDVVAQTAPQSFDISVWQFLAPLLFGGSVRVLPSRITHDPKLLLEATVTHGITVLEIVPSLLSAVLEEVKLSGSTRTYFPRLRWLISTGEALPTKLAREWAHCFPRVPLLNAYGPAECADDVSCHRVQDPPALTQAVAVGRPVGNTQIYILDRSLSPVPVGATGEICVGGAGVGRGYFQDAGRTAAAFTPDPFGGAGARLYRTGDLGRFRPSGEIEYLGRSDHQVKLRGFRIELGEIEAAIEKHPAAHNAVVLARGSGHQDKRLVAYVVPARGEKLTEPALRRYLRERLPRYMVPSSFVWLESLPLGPSGKIDRRALPEPAGARPQLTEAFEGARSLAEEGLRGIWQEVLNVDGAGIRDDFFELGGHSLLATRVMSRINKTFGVDLPLRRLFENPTIATLARIVERAMADGSGATRAAPLILTPARRAGPIPLSFAQQRLWFLDQFEPGRSLHTILATHRLSGRLHVSALEKSFEELVRRHEILRTRFLDRDGQPQQVVEPASTWKLSVRELGDLPLEQRNETLKRALDDESGRHFELSRGPLLRALLFQLQKDEHVLVLNMHHIISDGWSEGVLYRELGLLYEAFVKEEPSPLPELPIQYADYAVWQRALLEGTVLENHLAYWRDQLQGMQALELPTDRPRPTRPSRRGGSHRWELAESPTRALKRLSVESGASLFMTLLAGVVTLLHRYSGQEDIIVGSPIANRNREETEGLIGFFVNMLPLRTHLAGDPSFRELVRRARETALDAFAHQDLPFEKLVEEMSPERDPARHPLFQISFALQNAPGGGLALSGVEARPQVGETRSVNFDLELHFWDAGKTLRCDIIYSRDLFDTSTVQRMARSLERLLEGVATDPDKRLSRQTMLAPSERHQLLVEWNDTEVAHPSGLLHELFESQVERTPEAVALVYRNDAITYRGLNRRANRLAHRLRSLGVGPETLVGIYLESSPDVVVSFLAVLKAGGAYVPLEPRHPVRRLELSIQESQLGILLTTAELSPRFEQCIATIVCLDTDRDLGEQNENNPMSGVADENPAYVLYTSGSTGRPKGVVVTHRAITNHMHWMQSALPLRKEDRVVQKTPFGFDASVWEFWAPLLVGARLVLTSSHGQRDPTYLVQKIREHDATILQVVPTLLELLIERNELAECRSLRRVLCGGERLKSATVESYLALGLQAPLYNVYGPTEATIHASFAPCDRAQTRDSVPIGRPIDNARILVLDRNLQRVPLGAPGELYITGAGLARGYLRRPDLTATAFIPNPFSKVAGTRMYRTGDYARYRPDGQLEFLGRSDDQVKVRGHRIELGDVEAALTRHESIEQCAAAVDRADGERIAAYFVVREQAEPPSPRELRAFLSELLPEVMLPAAFVAMNALPLTSSGKVDRGALPAPDSFGIEAEEGYRPPQNWIEESMATLWEDVLGINTVGRVGARDNFFELGGHSLLAVQVMSRIAKMFGVELPVRALFEAPTVDELSRELEKRREQSTGAPGPDLGRVERVGRLPLSYSQQRLWFLDELEGRESDLSAYNMCSAYRLEGELDARALERALCEVVRRHEVLRTRFASHDGQPEQVVQPARDWGLTVWELEGNRAERQTRLKEVLREESTRRFDLEQGGLFRAVLVRLEEGQHVLILNVHHIVSDGWSQGILNRELTSLYEAHRSGEGGEESSLADLPIQYVDYAVWQRKRLEGERMERQLGYWREQLEALTPLELPTDRPRPAVQSYRGGIESFRLTRELTGAVKNVGRGEGATLFMTLLAALNALLSRYCGQDDVVVGTVVAGRNDPALESLMGFFLNVLTLRTNLSGDPSFKQLLQRTRDVTLEALAHQDLPFEKLVEELKIERDLSRTPLFQVLFILQNVPETELSLQSLSVSPEPSDAESTPYDLVLECTETTEGLVGALEYNRDLFDATTIRRMLTHFEILLESVAAGPERPLSSVCWLSRAERHQMLVEWNDTEVTEVAAPSLGDAFEMRVERSPDATAVSCDGKSLSYRELNSRANRLARELIERGVGTDVVVGLIAHRGLELLTAMLAVIKAGGAYLPLDPSYPPARLAHAIRQSGSRYLLVADDTRARCAETIDLIDDDEEIAIVQIENAIQSRGNEANPRLRSSPDALAYLIFTSGSTGAAKGAMLTHRSLFNHLSAKVSDLNLTEADIVAQTASQSFDISVWQFLAILLAGGRVEIVSDAIVRDPQLLVDRVFRNQVTILEVVPSFLRAALDAVDNSSESRFLLARLRWLIPTGEALPPELARRWLNAYPDIPLLNAYGPAECTDDVTQHTMRIPPGENVTDMPIGRPLRNTRTYILDRGFQPVPVGCRGEIVIGGTPVGRGYVNEPSRTATSFVPNPFAATDGDRLYRTGDRGRFLADGTIEYFGRIDFQVKIRGYRIEPGEVEVALERHPDVAEAVVVARDALSGDTRLVTYVVRGMDGGDIAVTAKELRRFLSTTLPLYMVPSAFVFLDALPLNRNGKIDRRALPQPETLDSERDTAYEPPGTTTEKELASIWAELLDTDHVGCADDFFALGGQSLIAVRIMARIERQLGVKLPLATIFRQPTLRGLAAFIDEKPGFEASVVVPIQPQGARTPIFFVHPAGGHVLCYSQLARRIGTERPFYGIQARGSDGETGPHSDLAAMAADYLEAIQKRQARGPYLLAGWSMGAVVALELACQLRSAGEEVRTLVLVDPPALDAAPARGADNGASLEMFAKQFGIDVARSVSGSLESVLQQAREKGTVSSDMRLTSFRALYEVFRNNVRLMNEFRPRPFFGKATLFQPMANPRSGSSHRAWRDLVDHLNVQFVPGDHYSMIRGGDVRVLAARLRSLLDATDPRAGARLLKEGMNGR